MKHMKPFTILNICGTLALLVLIAMIGIRVHNANKAQHSASTASFSCSIQGIVENITPDISEQRFAKLENAAAANSEKEFEQVLNGMYSTPSPAPKVIVTAKGDLVTKNVTTDSEGKFKIVGLPSKNYELSATASSRASPNGDNLMATMKPEKIYFHGRSNATVAVRLEVRGDLLTVRGKITDAQGRPIAGAKIRGEPYPTPESIEATPPTRFAVSGADGSYELSGFIPDDIYKTAGYLGGGDPTRDDAGGSTIPFYAEVHVEADGFVHDKANTPKVPLVTERILNPARRLLKVLAKLESGAKGSSQIGEQKGILLPPSKGNTITGIDIALTKQTAANGNHVKP